MVLEISIAQVVRSFTEFECSLYLVILVLVATVILLLVCAMPLLLREDDEIRMNGGRDQATAPPAPGVWQNPEWKSSVHQSCQVGREGGVGGGGMVVMVTGAAGFIGLHVCLALKQQGHGVVGLDSFSSYSDMKLKVKLKKERKDKLTEHGVFVINGDINDALLLKKLFDMVSFTHVLHLAAQTSIKYASENPGAYVQSNIAGLVTLLEVCRKANPQPAFVWSSSNSVYGLNTQVPYSEVDKCDQPASLYAASKKAGEGFVHIYSHSYGLSTTTLRLGTVYGPWGRPDMAYWIFTRDIIRGKEIKLYEGPNHADLPRDWTYIDDIVRGCLAAMATTEKSTGSGGRKAGPSQCRTYNLGCSKPVGLRELLSIIGQHLHIDANFHSVEIPPNCSPFQYASVNLARKDLGYNPTTDPETGLRKFVDWFREYHSLPECSSCLTGSSPEPS